MSCPHCGASTPADARFCAKCGHSLEEAVTVAAPVRATYASPPTSPPEQRTSSSSSGWLTSSDSISHGRFAPGAILDGRYRIIGLLGRGGMGEVYRADDLRLGQPVALKFLPASVATDPVRLAQFHNEVRTARQVAHPNICRVYDIGDIEGQLFLTMEYVAGEDLATSLRRIGRFPEDKALEIARQLCAGLAAAHERGVIHRDLKPANVMLDDAGKVRVMDFGLAAVGDVDEIRVGTPAYMAPEQLLGREVTARSDIYSLGLVLYELFTGRRAFTASSLNDLVEQHQSGRITPPSTFLTTLDPAIERAILRSLDPDPSRRPSSALAVSAALPGGDPLAAALAAGETPSPEMVAAAGEGAGLSVAIAGVVFATALIGVAAASVLGLRYQRLSHLNPEMNSDVLAQKAREAMRAFGYTDPAQDEAYGFYWDADLVEQMGNALTPNGPSPLMFWYRRSQQPMLGVQFHHDLLTPGIVTADDPAPIAPRMAYVALDHTGRLMSLEVIPPQVEEPPKDKEVREAKEKVLLPELRDLPVNSKPDWTPVLQLAGIDIATLQPAPPQWNWLSSPDTRAAWTGTWPGTDRSLRVEAAALHGKPVAFQMIGPWTRPSRDSGGDGDGETAIVFIIFSMILAILIGGAALARRNLREGRGDRAGAFRLASSIVALLWLLWAFQVHVSPSSGLVGILLLAVCSTVFYGVLFWAIYIALEPFVRRHWPQTLMSWTTLLSGRVRDPIVGRDVLVGVALGALIAVLIYASSPVIGSPPPNTETLLGTRAVMATAIMQLVYAIRTSLFFLFLVFLLRLLLRREWAAGLALAALFGLMDSLDSSAPVFEGLSSFVYFSMLAAAVLRGGPTTLAAALFAANLLLNAPMTARLSSWYAPAAMMFILVPVGMAIWAFSVSLRRAAPAPRFATS